jgi:hypothetical protein
MNYTEDAEYLDLLEKYILKKESEVVDSWAVEYGVIRNTMTKFLNKSYTKLGRDYVIPAMHKFLSKK